MKKITLMISCILALISNVSHANEVWVKWGASESGSGTMADPKVVSTSTQFDDYMNGLYEATTVHLLAGEFLTRGTPSDVIKGKKGQRIRGAGADSTVIKIEN